MMLPDDDERVLKSEVNREIKEETYIFHNKDFEKIKKKNLGTYL